jgi:hypothetical protein
MHAKPKTLIMTAAAMEPSASFVGEGVGLFDGDAVGATTSVIVSNVTVGVEMTRPDQELAALDPAAALMAVRRVPELEAVTSVVVTNVVRAVEVVDDERDAVTV